MPAITTTEPHDALNQYNDTILHVEYDRWPQWIKDTFLCIGAKDSTGLEQHGSHAMAVFNYRLNSRSND